MVISVAHNPLKDDNDWRPTGDYRRLNAKTIPDHYPLPHIHDLTDTLKGTTVFSYLEGNPIHVDFHSVQPNDTAPTLMIPQPTANTRDDTSAVSQNKLKTKRSGRGVRFLEQLNDYCTLDPS
ncbi:unnamed protein product [Schistosoma margrebowiei]|uniref:Uncharacterized protein n=1 Tax=Schistosoma margrebowiei TaxID=48269 RepID=A0A183NA12_9TREM|nr:unnamed protein product [Schistosoma margrebowiei]